MHSALLTLKRSFSITRVGLFAALFTAVLAWTPAAFAASCQVTSSSACVVAAVNKTDCNGGVQNCDLVTKYINPLVNFLIALVGIAVVISIVIGGIQYGSSGGDPQKVTAAKNRIRNSLVALVTFIFLFAILNFLIPGGPL